jgi:RsiW-degrading membrane proteinase PrsW (M82 family)
MNPPTPSSASCADPEFQTKLKTACLMLLFVPFAVGMTRESGQPVLDRFSLVPFVFWGVASVGWFLFARWLFDEPASSAARRLWPAYRSGMVFAAPLAVIAGPCVRAFLPTFMDDAAMGPGASGFLACVVCQFLGVGLVEETAKWGSSHPLRPASPRQRLSAGFMAGLGFGLMEGLYFSFRFYAGQFDSFAYPMRFISCVSTHASWSALAAVWLVNRRRSSDPWTEAGSILLRISPVAFIHGFSNACMSHENILVPVLLALGSHLLFGRELRRTAPNDDNDRTVAEETPTTLELPASEEPWPEDQVVAEPEPPMAAASANERGECATRVRPGLKRVRPAVRCRSGTPRNRSAMCTTPVRREEPATETPRSLDTPNAASEQTHTL